MKILGHDLSIREAEVVYIPRGKDIIEFKIGSVLNYDEFDELCPIPKPPIIQKRGGENKPDYKDSEYKKKIEDYATKRTYWLILQSLKLTEGLEWETVDDTDPETWINIRKELEEAKFTDSEIGVLITKIQDANVLSEERLQEARKSFLALQEEQQKSSTSQAEEQ